MTLTNRIMAFSVHDLVFLIGMTMMAVSNELGEIAPTWVTAFLGVFIAMYGAYKSIAQTKLLKSQKKNEDINYEIQKEILKQERLKTRNMGNGDPHIIMEDH